MKDTAPDFLLRPHRPDEVEALRRLERDAHRRFLTLPGFSDIAAAPAIAPERFARGETLVAHRGAGPIGYVILETLDGAGYVASLMVADGLSGQGIGRALLAAAEARSTAQGNAEIRLATFRAPAWNGPWYRRQGYAGLPEAEIGPELRAVLTRHAGFLDMRTRETLRKPLA